MRLVSAPHCSTEEKCLQHNNGKLSAAGGHKEKAARLRRDGGKRRKKMSLLKKVLSLLVVVLVIAAIFALFSLFAKKGRIKSGDDLAPRKASYTDVCPDYAGAEI